MTVLLDASALIALLNEEPGAELVREHMEDTAISAVNMAEVATSLIEIGWSGKEVAAHLSDLQIDVLEFDASAALLVGQLQQSTKQTLSFGAWACLATARRDKLRVLTADRNWSKLKLRGLQIRCIC